jgi:hypothetical protein
MDKQKIAAAYQELIRPFFPTVIVTPDVNHVPYPDIYDAFFLPDERLEEYLEFEREILPELVENAKLPDITLIPHWTSDTLKYYPKVCQRVDAEQAASHAAAK